MTTKDWMHEAAIELASLVHQVEPTGQLSVPDAERIITEHCPFKPGVAYEEVVARPGPLLACIDCKNTESPAGAMARQFNHGRCVFCGGYFKVIRA